MKPYRYLLLATLSLPLFACSGEDGEDKPTLDPDTPVALSPQIARIALTKASASNSDIKAISLFAVNNTAGETFYGANGEGTYGKYTLQSGSLKPSAEDQTIWLNMQQAKVYSYFPATDNNGITKGGTSSSYTYTIQIPANAISYSQQVTNASSLDFTTPQTDYMYGVAYNTTTNAFTTDLPVADNGHAATGTPKGSSIAIGMKHAFCQVVLKFKKNTDYVGSCNLTKVTYSRSIPTLNATGATTMNLANGTLTNLTGANTATPVNYEYTVASGVTVPVSTDGIEFINYGIPFASGTANVSAANLTVIVDGKEMTLQNISDGGEWLAGYKYTYTISIHGTGLKLDGFNIVGWLNEPSDNTNTTI